MRLRLTFQQSPVARTTADSVAPALSSVRLVCAFLPTKETRPELRPLGCERLQDIGNSAPSRNAQAAEPEDCRHPHEEFTDYADLVPGSQESERNAR